MSFSAVGVTFDEGDALWQPAYRLELGYRFSAWGPFRTLLLTPKLGLEATHVKGINPHQDDYSYDSLSLAVRATHARWHVRPYFEWRKGSHSAERLDGVKEILDFKGGGNGFGFGMELPISKNGRGLELGVTVTSGTFNRFEFKSVDNPADIKYRAIALHVGWS